MSRRLCQVVDHRGKYPRRQHRHQRSVTNLATNKQHTHHNLVARTGHLSRGLISYRAALVQSLLNKTVGNAVEATAETGTRTLRIDRIEKAHAEIFQALSGATPYWLVLKLSK